MINNLTLLLVICIIALFQFYIWKVLKKITNARDVEHQPSDTVKRYHTFDIIRKSDDNPYDCLIDNTKYLPSDAIIKSSSWTVTPTDIVTVHYTDFLWGEGLTALHVKHIVSPTNIEVQYDVCFQTSNCTKLKMISVVNSFTIMPSINSYTRGSSNVY